MTTTITSLSVRYELSTGCRDHLGANALSIWDRAFAAELEKSFPGASVEVDSRWSSVDASGYSVEGETADGESFAGSKGHFSPLSVYDGEGADIAAPVLATIASIITTADADAWDRACDLANAGATA